MNVEMKDIKETLQTQTLDVIIPSSDKYMKYVSVLMISAMENLNKNYRIFFHIVTEDISDATKQKIEFLKFKYDFDIEYKYIDNNVLISQLPMCVNKYIDSKIVYAKLLLASMFPELDKIIVLEGDMIVTGDLVELIQIDLQDNYMAAVKDMWYKEKEYLGISLRKQEYYVNTGMFYTSLSKWRAINFETLIIDKMQTIQLKWPDQDLFNTIFKGKIKYLEPGWNWGPNFKYLDAKLLSQSEKQYLDICPKKNIHYMCRQKAWNSLNYDYSEYFWYYARKSPFYETMLIALLPVKTVEIGKETIIDKKHLSDALNYRKNVLKYWRYKILSKITLGKTKKHYQDKRLKWKQKIKNAKKLRRGL